MSDERTTHFGLRGRATNVFPVESATLSSQLPTRPGHNDPVKLVVKLYWAEESRESESDILKMVHEIAQKEPQVKDHVPEMVWAHTFEDTSTSKIRRALRIDDAEVGSHALYIIVFRKLLPITKLSGDELLRAWWRVVCSL